MDFLESDAIAEEAVSVLRKELAAVKTRELALNDRLVAALLNESTRTQQAFEETKTLVRTLKDQAKERSTTCVSVQEEVDELKKKIKEIHKNIKKRSTGSKELPLLKAKVDKNVEKVKGYKARIQKEQEALKNLRELQKPLLYEEVLASYPPVSPSHKCDFLEHEPVGKDWQSLEEILDYNQFTKKYISESVCLSYSLGSHPPHAVVFAPTITFNETTRRWMPFSVSQGYDGKSYHLFVSNSSRIFYRGMYKFRRLQDHKCSDIRRAKGFDRCMRQVLDFAYPPSTSTNGEWKYLENLILDDVLPLECMVLQWLGFDHGLYENLGQQYRLKWGRLWCRG